MNRRTAVVLIGLLLITGGGFLSYRLIQVSRLPSVRVGRSDISVSVYASGTTAADRMARLAFKSTGRITYLPFRKNQEVATGSVVATIDTSDLAAIKEKELQDYLKTRWDFDEKQKDTYKDLPLTDAIKRAKDKAQFDLNQSVIDVEIADRALQNASLYSPFSGIVTEVNAEINEWVSAFSTEPLITIFDPATIYFEAEAQEEDFGKLRPGQEAKIALDGYPGKTFDGRVVEIDKTTRVKADGDTVIPVKINLSELPTETLLMGLNGDAQIILSVVSDRLVIPKRAVRKIGDTATVTIKGGWGTEEVTVTTGAEDIYSVEISQGLAEGQMVILPTELE